MGRAQNKCEECLVSYTKEEVLKTELVTLKKQSYQLCFTKRN